MRFKDKERFNSGSIYKRFKRIKIPPIFLSITL